MAGAAVSGTYSPAIASGAAFEDFEISTRTDSGMKIRYLLDENISPRLKMTLLRLDSSMDVLRIGEGDSPPLGTPDWDVLKYLEISQRVLVTLNRRSMPDHIEIFQVNGGRLFGLLWVRPETPVRIMAEELLLIWETTEAEEWIDRTEWIPL